MTKPENQAEALDEKAFRAAINAFRADAPADWTHSIAAAIRAYLASLPEAPAVPVVKALNAIEARVYGSSVNLGRDIVSLARDARSSLQSSPPVKAAAVDGEEEIEIDRLRLAAFKTNSNEDKAAYYLAVSKWFQDRHYRTALASQPAVEGEAVAWRDVIAERQRQISAEGWTPEHDDKHDNGEMARAAGIYALIAGADATSYRNARDGYSLGDYLQAVMDHYWPWERKWFKATNRRRDLVKAGALILAEIERLDRRAGG